MLIVGAEPESGMEILCHRSQVRGRQIVGKCPALKRQFLDPSLGLAAGVPPERVDIILNGGFGLDFQTTNGFTELQGLLTVGRGSLTVDNLAIR